LLNSSVTTTGGYGSKYVFENNQLFVNGNSNVLVHADLGSISFYGNSYLHVEGVVTGSKNIKLDMTSCSPSMAGLTTNISTFNFGSSMIKRDGLNLWSAKPTGTTSSTNIVPIQGGVLLIGRQGQEFDRAFLKNGVMTRSPNGTLYKMHINDNGTLSIDTS
jgi:hypothetical protein